MGAGPLKKTRPPAISLEARKLERSQLHSHEVSGCRRKRRLNKVRSPSNSGHHQGPNYGRSEFVLGTELGERADGSDEKAASNANGDRNAARLKERILLVLSRLDGWETAGKPRRNSRTLTASNWPFQ